MQVSMPRSRAGGRWLGHGGSAAVVVAAGALLLGACGGSGSAGGTTQPTTGTTGGSSSSSTSSTAGGGGSSTSSSVASGGGGASAIQQALQSGENATFDAHYSITGSSSGTTTYEFAQDGSKFAATYNSNNGTSEVISNGTNIDVCKLGSPAQCVGYPIAEASAFEAAFSFYTGKFWYQAVTGLQAYNGVAGFHETTSTMSQGGETLQCVTWSGGTGSTATGEVCVTPQGALGYVKATSSGSTVSTLTLTSYSTSVSASQFNIPAGATVQTLPAGVP